MPDGQPEPIELEGAWVGADELSVQFANAFSGVVGPNAAFVTIGTQVPPAIESERDFEQLKETGFLPIKPIVRIALTPGGLDDLIGSLEETRKNYQNLLSTLEEQKQQNDG